jgi:hypothetical protein
MSAATYSPLTPEEHVKAKATFERFATAFAKEAPARFTLNSYEDLPEYERRAWLAAGTIPTRPDEEEEIDILHIVTGLGTLLVSVEDIEAAGGLDQYRRDNGYLLDDEFDLDGGSRMSRRSYALLPELQ